MKKKKRILFIIGSLKLGGGAEKSVLLLTKWLSKDYDIELLTFYKSKKEYYNSVKRHNFGYTYSDNLIKKSFRLLILFPLRLKKKINKNKFDLVISNVDDANLVSLITKRFLCNFRLWVVVRSYMFKKTFIYRILYFLKRYANKIIFISKSLEYEFIGKNQITKTIYNPFDITESKNKDKETDIKDLDLFIKGKTLITIGRLTEEKNYFFLIDVFYKLYLEQPDLKLIILGDGPFKKDIKKRLKVLNIQNNIHLLGIRKNVFPYLRKSNVFVLGSKYEGFGRVIVEALSVGLPVVSNNCISGPSEILDNRLVHEINGNKYTKAKYGYLVPYNNKDEFIKAILDALKYGKDYRKKAIKRAKDFSIEKILIQWKEEIDKVI